MRRRRQPTWKKQPHRAHGAQRAITRRASALLSYLRQGKRRAGDSSPFSPVSGNGHAPCGVLPLANASDLISTWKKQPHRAHGAQRAITRRASALLSYLHQGKRRAGDSSPFSPPSGVSGSGHAPCGEWLRTKAGRSSCGRRRPKSLLRSKARRTHSRP